MEQLEYYNVIENDGYLKGVDRLAKYLMYCRYHWLDESPVISDMEWDDLTNKLLNLIEVAIEDDRKNVEFITLALEPLTQYNVVLKECSYNIDEVSMYGNDLVDSYRTRLKRYLVNASYHFYLGESIMDDDLYDDYLNQYKTWVMLRGDIYKDPFAPDQLVNGGFRLKVDEQVELKHVGTWCDIVDDIRECKFEARRPLSN